jgi:hypothetical protein
MKEQQKVQVTVVGYYTIVRENVKAGHYGDALMKLAEEDNDKVFAEAVKYDKEAFMDQGGNIYELVGEFEEAKFELVD